MSEVASTAVLHRGDTVTVSAEVSASGVRVEVTDGNDDAASVVPGVGIPGGGHQGW